MTINCVKPESAADIAGIVREAASSGGRIEILGGGSKRGLGRPVEASLHLDMTTHAGVTLYEPAELIVSAKAGTPLRAVTDLLAQHGQMLPFEPADYRPLLKSDGEATVGGMVATNLSGPRRLLVGACRDAVIGCKFVNGRGEEITAGGRVMKNVTGYDIGRAMSGAYGTLGILTEVTFKVLPRPQTTLTLLFDRLGEQEAVELMCKAAGTPFEVSAAAYLPVDGKGQTCLRLEGFEASITYRAGRLEEELAEFGRPRRLGEAESERLWRDIAAVEPVAAQSEGVIWRLMTPPTRSFEAVRAIRENTEARALYDWGGGLVWLSLAPADDGGAALVRAATASVGGHATLMRGGEEMRRRVPPFEPPSAAVARLALGLKKAFDPAGVLNPGRMYEGV